MIIRRRRTRNFTILGNEVVEDERLALDELGLLVWLRSRPDNWEVSRRAIQKRFNMGRDKCDRIFRALLGCGWMIREDVRGDDGSFSHPRYVVLDEPGKETQVADDEFAEAPARETEAPIVPPDHEPEDTSVASVPQPENPATGEPLPDEPLPGQPLPGQPLPENPAALIRTDSNQEESPPYPPPGGRSKIISESKRSSFERFNKIYPSPIVDYEATLRLWASMTDEDNEDAVKGARGYARFLADLVAKNRSRNVKDAHRWLKRRQWLGFLTAAKQAEDAAPAWVPVIEGSDDANEWLVFNRIRGRESRFVNGKMMVPSTRPPPVGDGKGEWVVAVEGTGQLAAWLRRLREGSAGAIGLRQFKIDGRWQRGLLVPSEWPPPKTVPGTLCTDEDMRELARG